MHMVMVKAHIFLQYAKYGVHCRCSDFTIGTNSIPLSFRVLSMTLLVNTIGANGTNVTDHYEPRREKTDFLHMRKQRRRSASR